jgi:cytosine/adenosine deaminase-related metal-dependent hydrolase
LSVRPAARLVLRRAALLSGSIGGLVDVALEGARVAEVEPAGKLPPSLLELDLAGRLLSPGLVNAHDHLDLSTFPGLAPGRHANAYDWAAALEGVPGEQVKAAAGVPLADRLFLGGLRNLLAGVTAVAHHGAFHRSLARPDFPVRALARYQFAHAPGLVPSLRRTYRTTDRRLPWFVHVAEGTDERARGELDVLVRENVLRQNTVMIHAIALPAEKLPTVAEARASVVWCPEANRRLYAATADVRALVAAGVRVGLGSDSAATGVRDALSNLAAARREAVMPDADLLAMATAGSAEVARLPVGAVQPGGLADLIVAETAEGLLRGERAALDLVLVGGEPRFGDAEWMSRLDPKSRPLSVDGRPRRMASDIVRRAASLLRARPAEQRPAWTDGLDLEATARPTEAG